MKLEVNKENNIYILKFTKPDHTCRNVQFSEAQYECLKEHFNPPKKKGKQPAKAPNIEDVRAYFKEKGYSVEAANRFFEYYDTMEWRGANGNPVLNWKGKAIAVWFKPENKITEQKQNKSSFFQN